MWMFAIQYGHAIGDIGAAPVVRAHANLDRLPIHLPDYDLARNFVGWSRSEAR
jgi:hypothetical protein